VNKSLLDTDIFSEILKGVNQNIISSATIYRILFGQYTISTITTMEIIKGFHRVEREDRINHFKTALQHTQILPLDQPCAEIAGRIYADLEKIGQSIGRADPMIAAIAIHHKFTLITGNTSHFQRIKNAGYDLSLDNWR
jgi:tRNA(fMet)-specific endonuclease VapC